MAVIKVLLALTSIAIFANRTGYEVDSPEVFLGFCMVMAGFVAYSEKKG